MSNILSQKERVSTSTVEEIFVRGRVKILAYLLTVQKQCQMGERQSPKVKFASIRRETHLDPRSINNHLQFLIQAQLVKVEEIAGRRFYCLQVNKRIKALEMLFRVLGMQREMGKTPFKLLKIIIDSRTIQFGDLKKVATTSTPYLKKHLEYLIANDLLLVEEIDGTFLYQPNLDNPIIIPLIQWLVLWDRLPP